jgi:hypothetical protein
VIGLRAGAPDPVVGPYPRLEPMSGWKVAILTICITKRMRNYTRSTVLEAWWPEWEGVITHVSSASYSLGWPWSSVRSGEFCRICRRAGSLGEVESAHLATAQRTSWREPDGALYGATLGMGASVSQALVLGRQLA